MSYTYLGNIKTVIVNNLTQFQSDDSGSNFGVGYSGWDAAFDYCVKNDLDYFGAVFSLGGDANEPMAFGNGMWTWTFLVRFYVNYDSKDGIAQCDENSATLASNLLDVMFSPTNRRAIAPSGWAKLTAANYIGETTVVNDRPYVSMEFIVSVREQIEP